MKSLLIMAAACLALSACTTTSIDTAIQTNLPKACQIVETAHVAFSAVAATGQVKARTVAKVEAAYGGVTIICTNPAGVTAADALIRVVSASVVISTALKEARAAE
ncbi:cell wall anchor protein [Pararhizobium sp. DWP1-1-3]|uniref:cell wall anchor protein n=1 Tax=Pararhizobium sp. DWP1-1-3 TaxID=2804652 RepID=UPI003CF8C370